MFKKALFSPPHPPRAETRFPPGFVLALMFSFICLAGIFSYSSAHATLSAPADLQVIDTPNDGGGSLTVVWAPSPLDGSESQYQVLIGEPGAGDPASLKVIAEFPANTR